MDENKRKCIDCGKIICRVSIRCKSCSNRNRKGKYKWSKKAKERKKTEKNPNWKGNKVKYGSLHDWMRIHKPKPKFCEKCKVNKPYELANISGKYFRDINDFRWLCRSCHSKEHRGKDWHNQIIKFKKVKQHAMS